jgi:hypothetical protein
MVSPWGLGVVSTVAEEDGGVASRCHTFVTLTQMRSNWSKELIVMGIRTRKLSVQHSTFAIATKRSLTKCFDRSWVYFLAWFWGFEGYEHGPRTNTRWMTSPHWLFENLDCSRKFLLLLLPLGEQEGIDATRSSRFTARDQVNRDFQKTITKKRKANKRVP